MVKIAFPLGRRVLRGCLVIVDAAEMGRQVSTVDGVDGREWSVQYSTHIFGGQGSQSKWRGRFSSHMTGNRGRIGAAIAKIGMFNPPSASRHSGKCITQPPYLVYKSFLTLAKIRNTYVQLPAVQLYPYTTTTASSNNLFLFLLSF